MSRRHDASSSSSRWSCRRRRRQARQDQGCHPGRGGPSGAGWRGLTGSGRKRLRTAWMWHGRPGVGCRVPGAGCGGCRELLWKRR
eukprot:3108252-Heterocapsa_arctica.AAC.1